MFTIGNDLILKNQNFISIFYFKNTFRLENFCKERVHTSDLDITKEKQQPIDNKTMENY